MTERTQIFHKVTIVGIGLIGGSVGMAIKKHHLAREVVGVARQHASLVHALRNRAIDRGSHDIPQAVAGADLVILSTPVKSIVETLTTIGPHLKRGCIVTDVGSTKGLIVDAAQKHLPAHVFFVGSHPLTGSEKKGAQYGSSELFDNSVCLMTPNDKTNKMAVEKVKSLWTKIGATVKSVTPAEHDKLLGFVSHLPHVLAYGLMASIPGEYLAYAPQGLKDMTRIASSDPVIWNDICMTNTKNIIKSLDEFVRILALFRKSLASGSDQSLVENFTKAKNKRDGIISG